MAGQWVSYLRRPQERKERNMTGDYLLLDPEIRDWVVIPMVMMVVMVGMGRHYAQELM